MEQEPEPMELLKEEKEAKERKEQAMKEESHFFLFLLVKLASVDPFYLYGHQKVNGNFHLNAPTV